MLYASLATMLCHKHSETLGQNRLPPRSRSYTTHGSFVQYLSVSLWCDNIGELIYNSSSQTCCSNTCTYVRVPFSSSQQVHMANRRDAAMWRRAGQTTKDTHETYLVLYILEVLYKYSNICTIREELVICGSIQHK